MRPVMGVLLSLVALRDYTGGQETSEVCLQDFSTMLNQKDFRSLSVGKTVAVENLEGLNRVKCITYTLQAVRRYNRLSLSIEPCTKGETLCSTLAILALC